MSLTGGAAKSLMFKSRTQVSRTATLATVDEEDTAAIAVRELLALARCLVRTYVELAWSVADSIAPN